MKRTRTAAVVVTAALSMAAAGCSSDSETASDGSSSSGDSGAISVVASTNVWGDIAQQVGGDDVKVTSIISDPDQDPHSYEADATTLLEVSKAAVVIENGGGYDDFVERLIDSSNADPVVINAVDVSGKTAPAGGELNEHVWYDLPTVAKVADAIAAELGKADPSQAATFTANADAFKKKLDGLTGEEEALKKKVSGESIGITEPVPLYLTDALGLTNKTPEAFSEAVEEGDDVSPSVLKETLDLYTSGEVSALVYNAQTSGPITEEVQKAAEAAGIPVVPVTETLPANTGYVAWMSDNISRLATALS